VIVPEAVWQEVVEGGHNDLAAKGIQKTEVVILMNYLMLQRMKIVL
jgi:hypothetical protein